MRQWSEDEIKTYMTNCGPYIDKYKSLKPHYMTEKLLSNSGVCAMFCTLNIVQLLSFDVKTVLFTCTWKMETWSNLQFLFLVSLNICLNMNLTRNLDEHIATNCEGNDFNPIWG